MEVLDKIFGSAAKIKIMRLFLFHPGVGYDVASIASHTKVRKETVRKEVSVLLKAGLIKKKEFQKEEMVTRRKKRELVKKRVKGWILNENFVYKEALEHFLIDISPVNNRALAKRFAKVGTIKLLVVAGVFIHDSESRVDLLVVGDKMKKSAVEGLITTLESEIGKELRYSFLDTTDFEYRFRVCDKLIRDILDYNHEKVVNKLEI
jgi:hypothetical protein